MTTELKAINEITASKTASEGGGVASKMKDEDAQYRDIINERGRILAARSPVSDEMLRNPPAQDWLSWRRCEDGYGFTPLTQINSGM